MVNRPLRSPRSQTGYSAAELVIGIAIIASLLGGLASWRYHTGQVPIFLNPGTSQAARQLVSDSLSVVEKVGEPAITGDRMVTLPAKIARKDCKIQLRAPDQLENNYGWKITQIDCTAAPVA